MRPWEAAWDAASGSLRMQIEDATHPMHEDAVLEAVDDEVTQYLPGSMWLRKSLIDNLLGDL